MHQIPHYALPKGFLDAKNIEEAKRTMSSTEFTMEYEAGMVSDSEGFFKASVLSTCTINSGFSIKSIGDSDKGYVVGIDPSQGGAASSAIVVVELGEINKIVFAAELKQKTTQQVVVEIQRITDVFNVERILMDSQGGGKPIRDLLEEGYGDHVPILDIDNKYSEDKEGKRILKLVNPSVSWISDANFGILALFENKKLRFPEPVLSSSVRAEAIYEIIQVLKAQLLSIVVTQTARGFSHFDTPKRGKNKDLYSAIVLAAWGLKELNFTNEEPSKLLYNGIYTRQKGEQGFSVFSGL